MDFIGEARRRLKRPMRLVLAAFAGFWALSKGLLASDIFDGERARKGIEDGLSSPSGRSATDIFMGERARNGTLGS